MVMNNQIALEWYAFGENLAPLDGWLWLVASLLCLTCVFCRIFIEAVPIHPQSLAVRALKKTPHLLIEALRFNHTRETVKFSVADEHPFNWIGDLTVAQDFTTFALD